MSDLYMFYSYGGDTQKLAQSLASQSGGELCEIKEVKRRTIFGAFFRGCPAAVKRRPSNIISPDIDFSQYSRVVLMAPVWANYPAPAFNAMAALLPKGTQISVKLLSGSGKSTDASQTKSFLENMGLEVLDIEDIKTEKK